MKIYELRSDFNFPQFVGKRDYHFAKDTLLWTDKIKQEMYLYDITPALNGKKNFKFDVSLQNNHIILSDDACDLFENYGTFFDIKTASKRKFFKGFFPNKCVLDDSYLNLKTSDFKVLDSGNIAFSRVCFNKKIEDVDFELFVVNSVLLSIYVTDEFKKKIEQKGLLGLDFILVYDSSLPVDWKFQVIKDALNDPAWEKIIREAYSLEKSFSDFEIFTADKEIIEELPFLAVYKDYKDEIESFSLNYPNITNYKISCALDNDLKEKSEVLKKFYSFLYQKGIYLKMKYMGMFPSIEYFDDGVIVGGHFAKGLTKKI